MPELPEVETVKRGLQQLLPDRSIANIEHDWPKSFPNAANDVKQFLIGARVLRVRRRAKVLLIELSSNYSLVIHLKMTGQLVFRSATTHFGAGHPNDSLIGDLPDKSTRVTLSFADGSTLFFNDQRKFGWIRLLPTVEVPMLDFFKKVGPEPLADDFMWQDLRARLLRRKKSSIKAALLDQTVIAGVGNIYADESLWGAKIHPQTLVGDLSDAKHKLLYSSLRTVLQLSIDKGGSTAHTYVNAEGRRGSYLQFANVFRKEGQQCPRCQTVIIKIRVAGRGTHLCPRCQKLTTSPDV
ncbi:MAG TPA: bifunctional DNA-formamidopyrimidine glycosylase/DNA-(apurinic or apyrimidinic site) lyase [Candidatus Saccharimonadales bacterium]|nr:bifunctional DNA-formamidopyrimidine glycosylase/DNA-(apurinic or apyrimidinic site) lyase [Candidatus Saccharimonadales bacterium]